MKSLSEYGRIRIYGRITNPVSDAYSGWIELARRTAPVVTVTAIIGVIGTIWAGIAWRFMGFPKGGEGVFLTALQKKGYSSNRV